jgi:hypothetical protein
LAAGCFEIQMKGGFSLRESIKGAILYLLKNILNDVAIWSWSTAISAQMVRWEMLWSRNEEEQSRKIEGSLDELCGALGEKEDAGHKQLGKVYMRMYSMMELMQVSREF